MAARIETHERAAMDSDTFKSRWGSILDSAETYASGGCQTAPPELLGISADFFLDLVLLAKTIIKTPNTITRETARDELMRRE